MVQAILAEKAGPQEHEAAGHIAGTVRKQREMNDQEAEGDERWGSTCFLLLMGSGPQSREWGPPC